MTGIIGSPWFLLMSVIESVSDVIVWKSGCGLSGSLEILLREAKEEEVARIPKGHRYVIRGSGSYRRYTTLSSRGKILGRVQLLNEAKMTAAAHAWTKLYWLKITGIDRVDYYGYVSATARDGKV